MGSPWRRAKGAPASAMSFADVSYSWSGHLRLFDDAGPDPWLIGQDGAEFVLQTTVSGAGTDLNFTQVPFAVFAAAGSRLWVDGEESVFVGDAHIDFTDTVDSYDIVTAGGMFSRFGQVVGVSSTVGLDAATYSFSLPSEFPPHFSSRLTMTVGEVIHQPYITSVGVNNLVTVVPEPASFVLTFGGFALVVLGRRRPIAA